MRGLDKRNTRTWPRFVRGVTVPSSDGVAAPSISIGSWTRQSFRRWENCLIQLSIRAFGRSRCSKLFLSRADLGHRRKKSKKAKKKCRKNAAKLPV
jgi:hypothetical protein